MGTLADKTLLLTLLALELFSLEGAAKSDCVCGKVNRPEEEGGGDRIVGGSDAGENEYPWQVFLQGRISRRKTTFCGGTVISDRWLISAAHCFVRRRLRNPKRWLAALGEHDRTELEMTVGVEEIVRHPLYDNVGLDFDFALLRLDEPVDFGGHRHVRPACLPTFNPEPGTKAVVTGWGDTLQGRFVTPILQEVEVPILSREDCVGPRTAYRPQEITDRMFCAGDLDEGGIDACAGDSGGPLVVADPSTDSYEVHGVVSWGFRCAIARAPGVYANVTVVLDWIEEVTGMNGDFCPRML